MRTIPEDYPVRPLQPNEAAKDRATCGTCGRSWDDGIPTSMTPAPSARCPFESFHDDDEDSEDDPADSGHDWKPTGVEGQEACTNTHGGGQHGHYRTRVNGTASNPQGATAREWIVHVTDGGAVYISDSHDFSKATFFIRMDGERERAEIIVRAVNSLPLMLDAFSRIVAATSLEEANEIANETLRTLQSGEGAG